MQKSILIVEDEEQIVGFINNRLDSQKYCVNIALDGQEALSKIFEKQYDLVTLDIMLPHVDGLEICRTLREKSTDTLIVIISALDTLKYKEQGYACGADDYIAKPFSAKELAIKITSLLRRKEEILANKEKRVKHLILNEASKEIVVNGHTIEWTPSEYLLLSTMIVNKNRLYSRQELAQIIYNNNLGDIDEQGINSHIYNIRKKVEQFYDRDIIKTVRGMGYKIYEN
ncbi:MAG TPA: response regulator transcription factor [Nitratifractor sp.]|nr:response regulator transcription factor [Nitratifractor sp.]